MKPPAYLLDWNIAPYETHDIMCRIVEFPGWNSNRGLRKTEPLFQPSEPVEFDAHFELIECDAPDYPNNPPRWPLMSHRMLDVLRSVGEFDHHAIPVTLVQDTIPVEVRYFADGTPKPEYSKTNYVAVQLTSHADVFDFERSKFDMHPRYTDLVCTVKEFVLHVPDAGLPPLFRVAAYPLSLLVSAEARAALEAAGIRGPDYKPLKRWPLV